MDQNNQEKFNEKTYDFMDGTQKNTEEFEKFKNQQKKSSRSKVKKKDKSLFLKIVFIAIDWLIAFGIAIILTILITSVISQGKISGNSMMPTYQNGEHILVQRSFYNINHGDVITFWAEPQEGSDNSLTPGPIRSVIDGIIFREPDLANKELHIKRVVGIPGDHIVVSTELLENGSERTEVYVNDEMVAASDVEITANMDIVLGEGEYFVVGDNYDNSYDSRYHGPVQENDIFGKVVKGRENTQQVDENGNVALKESDTESVKE